MENKNIDEGAGVGNRNSAKHHIQHPQKIKLPKAPSKKAAMPARSKLGKNK